MLWLAAESDDTRRWNAQELCRLKQEQRTAASYLYFFDWFSPVHNNRMGAYHTLDIPFVFYNMDIGASMTGASNARYQLGHVMSAAWAAFARTGDPNHADMPRGRSSMLPTICSARRCASPAIESRGALRSPNCATNV
jgi:para-nitrobenzyl esterase